MKKVLIITYSYPPYNYGLRALSLNRFLPDKDWSPVVVAFRGTNRISENENPNINYIGANQTDDIYIYGNIISRFFQPDKSWAGKNYSDALNLCSQLLTESHFDLIIATSCNVIHVFTIAMELSIKHKIPWVCDVRDIDEQFNINFKKKISSYIQFLRYKYRRNYIISKANAIITISKWHKEFLQKELNRKVELIYNGYDPEDFKIIEYDKIDKTDEFEIIYSGTLVSDHIEGLKLLMDAVELIIKNNQDINISIKLYGDIEQSVQQFLGTYKNDFVRIMGRVPFENIVSIINNSSLLIVLTNSKYNGVMSTKLFEYLTTRKPIICLPKDDGSIESVLHYTQTGFSFNKKEDICDYILSLYKEWSVKGYTTVSNNKEQLETFSRKNQAYKFSEVLNSLI